MIKFREMMFGNMEVALTLLIFLYGVASFLGPAKYKMSSMFPNNAMRDHYFDHTISFCS